jgi:hypothetical protein
MAVILAAIFKMAAKMRKNMHFCTTGTLLKTGRITDYNTPNQCQPLICAKDHCLKIRRINNLSYCMETIFFSQNE